MKKRMMVLVSLMIGAVVSAEAPELKQVMPNSWQKVTRLEAAEEEQFLKDTEQVWHDFEMEEIYQVSNGKVYYEANSFEYKCTQKAVYRQQVGSDVFYRLIRSTGGTEKLNDYNHWFMQVLFRPIKGGGYQILGVGRYNNTSPTQQGDSDEAYYASIDIIESKGRAKGILFTTVTAIISPSYTWGDRNHAFLSDLAGNDSFYFLLENLPESGLEFSMACPEYFPSWSNDSYKGIKIYASVCLFDKKNIFKYSLQNAFDSDPSTSYVENTKDNLMEFSFQPIYLTEKIAIINGYAANENLYYANNRIKTVRTESNETVNLTDNTLTYQILPFVSRDIYITDIYKGSKYTDTCIAELNLFFSSGWLFGDIDE